MKADLRPAFSYWTYFTILACFEINIFILLLLIYRYSSKYIINIIVAIHCSTVCKVLVLHAEGLCLLDIIFIFILGVASYLKIRCIIHFIQSTEKKCMSHSSFFENYLVIYYSYNTYLTVFLLNSTLIQFDSIILTGIPDTMKTHERRCDVLLTGDKYLPLRRAITPLKLPQQCWRERVEVWIGSSVCRRLRSVGCTPLWWGILVCTVKASRRT